MNQSYETEQHLNVRFNTSPLTGELNFSWLANHTYSSPPNAASAHARAEKVQLENMVIKEISQ